MKATVTNLYGLILAGGRSKRMGQDKALLVYQPGQKTQVECAFAALTPFCEKVFVSTRADQSHQLGYQHLPQLPDLDAFKDQGPLGGILSAMQTFPQSSWIILACDLPNVTVETIRYLIEQRNPQKPATAFISTHDQLPEPLCAIWEGYARPYVLDYFQQGVHCPRKVLIKMGAHQIVQQDSQWLDNINTPQEYESALKRNNKSA